MKSILKCCLFLLLFPQQVLAQEFISTVMKDYFATCMKARTLIMEKKCDDLLLCAKKMIDLNITELGDSDFVSMQPDKEKGLDGHVVFTDAGLIVVAEAIINGNSTKYNLHNINRGNGIFLTHRVIPANSTMKYRITNLVEDIDLLLFQEKIGNFRVSLIDDHGNRIIEDTSLAETGWGLLKFCIDIPSSVTAIISNNENVDICCAFAINGQ